MIKELLFKKTIIAATMKIPIRIGFFILLLTALASFQQAGAQTIRVSGTITGANDEPLSGVSVSEKGTSNGCSLYFHILGSTEEPR